MATNDSDEVVALTGQNVSVWRLLVQNDVGAAAGGLGSGAGSNKGYSFKLVLKSLDACGTAPQRLTLATRIAPV